MRIKQAEGRYQYCCRYIEYTMIQNRDSCILRTKIIVDVPVIANTVQTSTISPYQASVPRGGISFGPRNLCRKVFSAAADFAAASAPFLGALLEKYILKVGRALLERSDKEEGCRRMPLWNVLEATASLWAMGLKRLLANEAGNILAKSCKRGSRVDGDGKQEDRIPSSPD